MIINGNHMDFPAGINITEMLGKLGLDKNRVVVEVNLKIIQKENFDNTLLNSDDKVEIVSFVGGG